MLFYFFIKQNVANAQKRRSNMAVGFQRFEIAPCAINGDRKTDVLSAENHSGVNADCLSLKIHQRSAGISGINGGIGLNKPSQAFVMPFRVSNCAQKPRKSGYNADRYSVLKFSEGISNSNGGLPKPNTL